MAQEYITLENSSNLGTVRLNKSVFYFDCVKRDRRG